MAPKTKICTSCHQEQPLSDFSKKLYNSDGLQDKCKGCYNEEQREYRRKHKEMIARIQHQSYLNHKEEYLERKRRAYREGKQDA